MSAWLHDGETARRWQVRVVPAGGALRVVAGDVEGTVPANLLTLIEDRGVEIVLGRTDRRGWRLGIPKPVPPDIIALIPSGSTYGRWIDRIGLVRASVIGLVVSIIVLLTVHALPHWLAPMIPDRWMHGYGDALVGDFGGRFCAGPGGQDALDRLARRLAPDMKDLKVRVVNIPIVNAAALPGGNIVVFRELLSEAGSAEEFAGVLGHEIAHVRHHDVAEAMIREMGLGLVVSSIGGDVGSRISRLASLSYSRDAERAADAAAIAALKRADIAPAPTAKFFDRLSVYDDRLGGRALAYLSTHPLSKARGAAFRAAAEPGHAYGRALPGDDWDALADICHNDPKQQQ